jgi:transcriptional regulator with XRE-family HTH domain
LAGLSVRSYAALERGAANPSVGLVESVAAGLWMTPAERSSLHVLATREDPPMPAIPPGGEWQQISPGLRDLIAQLDPLPAAITDEMWTVMARNQALTALTGGWFDQVPRDQQNLVLFLFSPEGDRLLPEVHAHRRAAAAGCVTSTPATSPATGSPPSSGHSWTPGPKPAVCGSATKSTCRNGNASPGCGTPAGA